MLGPLNVNLAEFGVSPQNGFLPDQLPLQVLSDQNWACWESTIQLLPSLLKSRTFRTEVDGLPILSASNFESEQEWQRAYLILAFMAHAYIWEAGGPSEVSFLLYTLVLQLITIAEITTSDFRPISPSCSAPWSPTDSHLCRT